MRIKVLAAAAVMASALALTACGGSSSSSSTSSATAFCDKVHELNQLNNPFGNVQPGDIQGAKDALSKVITEAQSLESVAPSDIKSEVGQLQKVLTDFAAKIKNATSPADLLQAAQSFQTEQASLQASAAKVKTWTDDNCKK